MTRMPLRLVLLTVLAAGIFTACTTRKPGQIPKPGFNSYTPEQDIEIGRQAAAQVDQTQPIVHNVQLERYVSQLGETLAHEPQAGNYPYAFKIVNDPAINAFALPGGPVYLNSGVLETADNEAQVAGVLAHEISHVALRHGTNQASKARLFDLLGGVGGAILGGGAAERIGRLGLNLGISSVLLKYSRTAESQADLLGTHIMAAAGYNPVEMARFFERLQRETADRPQNSQFLSDHPDPGNRMAAVSKEIQYLPKRSYTANTGEFPEMKEIAQTLPIPPEQTVR